MVKGFYVISIPKEEDIAFLELKKKITKKKQKQLFQFIKSRHPCNLDQIYNFSKKSKIKVIEDSALWLNI